MQACGGRLINVVKNYTVLYDVTLKDFKNNTVKENVWARVSAEFGVNGMYLSHASWCVLQKNHNSDVSVAFKTYNIGLQRGIQFDLLCTLRKKFHSALHTVWYVALRRAALWYVTLRCVTCVTYCWKSA